MAYSAQKFNSGVPFAGAIQKACASLMLVLVSISASAQNAAWTASAKDDQDFMNSDNWDVGVVPDVSSGYGFIFLNNLVSGGPAILDGDEVEISSINVGQGAGNVGELRIINGGQMTASGSIAAVGQSGSVGTLEVSGEGSLFHKSGSGAFSVGVQNQGEGLLVVGRGGSVVVDGSFSAGGTPTHGIDSRAGKGTVQVGFGDDDLLGGSFVADEFIVGIGQSFLVFHHGNQGGVLFEANIVSPFSPTANSPSSLSLTHKGPGLTHMTGTVDYRGNASVEAGTLVLGGSSMYIDGDVTIGAGELGLGMESEGNRGARTLNIAGDLMMTVASSEQAPGSTLILGMGAVSDDPEGVGSGDLIRVGGTLLLDGSIKILDIGGEGGGPGFGIGRYELITYGDLHDDSRVGSVLLDLEGGLNGSLSVDNTADGGRIILTLDAGLGSLAYWGLTDGDWNSEGWSATENMAPPLVNWTDGIGAVFRGPDGGQVSISNPDGVLISSLSIETNGYVIDAADGGGPLRFAPVDAEGPSLVRFNVMDGISGHLAAAAVEGAAGLRFFKDGGGTLVLSNDDNHWTGGTTVNSGRLVIGDGGESGVLPGDVRLFGTLAFNRSDEYVFAGAITDGGTLRQIGSGTLVLTHDNSTSGWRTFIESGAVELRDDGRVGSGTIDIANGASLVLARAGDWTLTNTLTGSGALAQRGGGVLTLTGTLTGFTGALLAEHGRIDLGAGRSFGGSVTVDDQLVVNGSVTGAVTVRDGGRLGGTGSVGSLSVGNGGTVSPGNSIGTLVVTGNASFAANSVFEVEANSTGAADRINVGGTLNISGGTVQVLASPNQSAAWRPFTEYAILTHGGSRLGEFAEVDTDLAFLDPRLEYRPGMVVLHLDRSDIAFADVAITPNQRQAAAALEAVGLTHRVAGEVVPLYDQVVGGTSTDAILAFDAVSGELHASMAGMLLDDSRLVRDALLGRAALTAGRSTATQVWARALTHRGESKGSGMHDFERDAQGLLVGADHVLGDGQYGFGWTAGHHRNGEAEINTLRSQGEVKSTHVGAYLGSRAEGLGIRGGLAHSWHEVDTERTVAFTGFNEYVTANYKARTTQLFAEVDYEVEVAGQSIAPFLSVAWARLQTNRFMEADFLSPIGSTAGLRAGSQKHNATFATLGARADLELGERLVVDGMLGYRRTLSGDEPSLRMGFVDGAQGFTIHGAPLARDAMVADIGLALRLGQNIRIGAAYNGLLGSDVRDHAVEARLSIALQ